MRRKISLYIADRLVDMDDQNLVLFNYTMEDLSNPTIVRNSYSQQVTIPATPANNKIFGDYFRLDRVTGGGFNVLARTPFKIYNEMNEILESGYCKLEAVQSNGVNIHSYSISLYGGLGGFFYDLSYNEDGTPKNLGDITYTDGDGNNFVPNIKTFDLTAHVIYYCWLTLNDGSSRTDAAWANVVNFAPCNNGIPADFDSKKVLVDNNTFLHISPSGDSLACDRPHPDSNGTYLVTMETDKDENEIRDYRAYLQRPVLSLKAFLDAMEARGGFSVSDGVRKIITDGMWITLQLPARKATYLSYPMKSLFNGSMSPADLIITIAKTFGMVFLSDVDGVTMMTRNEFFRDGEDIDLSRRIDISDINVTPMTFNAKWYTWQNEVDGAFAKEYLENWNRTYGEHRVNTNYEFNTDTKVLTESLKTKGAVQSLGWSNMYQFVSGSMPPFPASFFEKVSFIGYNQAGTESEDNEVRPYLPYDSSRVFYNETFPLYDVFDKPQMHDKDRKPVDGAGVLLYYVGRKDVPVITPGMPNDKLRWHLTDDDQDMFNLLNDGNPCWDMRLSSGQRLYNLPQFSRWDIVNGNNLDFGIPSEVSVPSVTPPAGTIYERHWKNYIEDRYDLDSTIIRCKVNLGGFNVGQNLLRNFYWFDNTWWVLNKIVNHSLTTYDQTECEFVRVQDKNNYKNGQY